MSVAELYVKNRMSVSVNPPAVQRDSAILDGSIMMMDSSRRSLDERFSQVLLDQLTPRMVTFDPVLQQSGRPQVIMLVRTDTSPPPVLQTPEPSVRVELQRRSVWMRLGGRRLTRHLSASRFWGFWSFRNKYRSRAGFTWSCRRPGPLRSGLHQRRLLARRSIRKPGPGQVNQNLLRGGATAFRWRGLCRDAVPTKKQLDAQLDAYMSMSKSRLDQELDEYMSMSRRCLDAQLDEYMSMAGQKNQLWD